MSEHYHIVGAGLAGCIIASRVRNATIYESDKVGGLCRDNKNFQEYVHVVHTDDPDVYDFFAQNTTIRNHRVKFLSYVNGQYLPWYPKEITDKVIDEQVTGYSFKMWRRKMPVEAKQRIRTSIDEYFFHNKYEFIPDFTLLFENLIKGKKVVKAKASDRDVLMPLQNDSYGKIVMTGAIDEYFNYCFGKLPYRGIKSTHLQTEIRLRADCINFPDETLPFTRLVDYSRLGFEGEWMGIETPSNDIHYPIRNPESEAIYEKYRKLAESKGIILAGRLATFHYMDVDEIVEQCLNIEL